MTPTVDTQGQLARLNPQDPQYATGFVDVLLAGAQAAGVSDIHLQPVRDGLDVRWRLDGVLQPLGAFSRGEAADVVSRLKVLAHLLTYHTDRPQEGRIRGKAPDDVEMRISTFPTLHGERAVVRLFATQQHLEQLEDLGFPAEVELRLRETLGETSGALVVSGPAGSGKTTTAYASLRHLVRASRGGRSVMSLEDPIEVAVEGVAQSQVNLPAGLSLATGLRSLLRQDPEVILVGEIRDREAAETVFQAALTGHLVVTTFHAGSAAGAISRLADMGIEPYLLRSGVRGILNQRLVRRLCSCAQPLEREEDRLGLAVVAARCAVGCAACRMTGYRGRVVLTELLVADPSDLGRAILSRAEAREIEQLAVQQGMTPVRQRALAAVEAGLTSPEEVRRALGWHGGL